MNTKILSQKIGKNLITNDNVFIDKTVEIGDNVVIDSNVTIKNDVKIGDETRIYYGVQIGSSPQFSEYTDKNTGYISIGKNVILREYCTVNLPHYDQTYIGNDCYIMNHINISHDCIMGDRVTVANGSQIGGYCVIDEGVFLGLNSAIHQRSEVGAYSLIGMNTSINGRIYPFSLVYKDKISFNLIGVGKNMNFINSDTENIISAFLSSQSADENFLDKVHTNLEKFYKSNSRVLIDEYNRRT